MAALEVVHKRLAAAGLNDFCLTLHSHNAKRREVLDQLESSLKLAQNRATLSSSVFDQLSRLRLQRNALNDYSRELHTVVEPLDKSVFNVNGHIAKLSDVPDVSFTPEKPDTYSSSDLAVRMNLLDGLSRIVEESGYQVNNPWRGCILTDITNQFRQQFFVESEKAVKAIDNVVSSQNQGISYEDCEKCVDIVNLKIRLAEKRENIEKTYTTEIFAINGKELLLRCRTKYRNIFRMFNSNFKADRKQISDTLKTPGKMSFTTLTAVAENLKEIQEIENETYILTNSLPSNIHIDVVSHLHEQLSSPVVWFAGLFEYAQLILATPMLKLRDLITNCYKNISYLEYYIDYNAILKKAAELGIDGYIHQAAQLILAPKKIVPAFEKCFYRAWLDAVLPKFETIRTFRRLKQEDCISSFKELDKSHMEISKAALISKLISRLPSLDAFTSGHDELGLLKREMAKQRKLMPTRKLIASLPNLLPVLKPCIMMSPLSVSTYLSGGNYKFDTVIFDEASQVRTEDAICAIFRTKQTIIAGDSKQLPPTDFFSVSTSVQDDDVYDEDSEFDDTGAFESLLDEASLLRTQTLLWHYRSKHEHLIAFSNAKIYRGSLVTFPSSVESADNVGVQYIHVPGGIYDKGGKNGNRAEAKRVAELVFEHFNTNSNRSLGIIAFGMAQQSAIIDALIQKRRENPSFEQFFRDDSDEAIFIKNLETVQGDERDTIIFSIGYAPDAAGKFIMNFGPLSRVGGERRLNVAVTRARYNIKLVGSIQPTDIDIEKTSGEGPKLLRLYIDFAINGAKAILGEISNDKTISFDSPFEIAVYKFLTAHGYDVATQVGCSGYRIDMAVRHPKYNGRFAIGIECDGAIYHGARTARERDRLRQAVLEDMGWKLYRIWSTDWIKDPVNEGKRLISAIDDAVLHYREEVDIKKINNYTTPMIEYLNIENRPEQRTELLRPRYYGYSAGEVPISDFQNTMLKIISQSYGIDKEGLFKTTALCYGWQRRGEVIKSCMEKAYLFLLSNRKIKEINGKVEKV